MPYLLSSLGSWQWSISRFSFQCLLILFRSGSYKHILEVSSGVHKQLWGCFPKSVFLCNPLHTLWYSRASFLHALTQVWAFIYLQLPWNSHICTCDSRDERTEKGKQKLGTIEICFILLEPWSFDQRKFPYLRLLDTAAAYFHCCCYCYTIFLFGCWDIGGEREVNPWGFLLFSLNVKRLFFFKPELEGLSLSALGQGPRPLPGFKLH